MDSQAKRQRLKEIILQKSLKKGNFTLASGEKSTYLFDMKPTLLDPEGANLAADLTIEKLQTNNLTAVGGLELGACPLVSAVCVKSWQIDFPIKSFYVRKEKKGRGTDKLIEGCELSKDDKVILLEDVTTSGGSVKSAIKAVQALGCEVVKVISVIDRNQGAKDNMALEGIKLDYMFSKDELF